MGRAERRGGSDYVDTQGRQLWKPDFSAEI